MKVAHAIFAISHFLCIHHLYYEVYRTFRGAPKHAEVAFAEKCTAFLSFPKIASRFGNWQLLNNWIKAKMRDTEKEREKGR